MNLIPDIKNMTLREKIGQMFIMRDDRLRNMIADDEIKKYLSENPIGGLWATGRLKKMSAYLNFEAADNAGDLSELREYVDLLNKNLLVPLLVGGDSEKGGFMGTVEISGPDAAAAANDCEISYEYGACEANVLKCGGLNWRWSPIADLSNHNSSISVNRVCSDDPEKVISYCKNMIRGTQNNGVAATVKHFPGHDINETRDPHFMSSENKSDYESWLETQGRVYKAAIQSGVYSVMIGHTSFPAADDSFIGNKRRPASFSKKIITDLLKNEWGFDGVVVTDDIGMRSAFSVFGRENTDKMYIELINAGNDMLLGSPIGDNREDYIGYIEKAVKEGIVSSERIDDACSRVLNMKYKLGLFSENREKTDLNTAEYKTHCLNKRLAEKSLTLLSDSNKLLPLDKNKVKNIAIIYVTHSELFPKKLEPLAAALKNMGVSSKIIDIRKCNLQRISAENDVIIYANFVSAHQPMGHCTFFGEIAQQFFKIMSFGAEKSVVVSFGSPFIRQEYYEEAETYINAYWYNSEVMEALVKALFGEIPFAGISPFDL